MAEYNLQMPFIDESESFVHGFECGQIYERMNYMKKFDSYLFHSVNRKQVEMMCRRFGYNFLIETIADSGWCKLHAEPNITRVN